MTCHELLRDEAAFVRVWDGFHPMRPTAKISWQEYVAEMGKSGTYACELEAMALARAIDCMYHLHHPAWSANGSMWQRQAVYMAKAGQQAF